MKQSKFLAKLLCGRWLSKSSRYARSTTWASASPGRCLARRSGAARRAPPPRSRSVYVRFLGAERRLTDQELNRFTRSRNTRSELLRHHAAGETLQLTHPKGRKPFVMRISSHGSAFVILTIAEGVPTTAPLRAGSCSSVWCMTWRLASCSWEPALLKTAAPLPGACRGSGRREGRHARSKK
jgi:hypothetical protein